MKNTLIAISAYLIMALIVVAISPLYLKYVSADYRFALGILLLEYYAINWIRKELI